MRYIMTLNVINPAPVRYETPCCFTVAYGSLGLLCGSGNLKDYEDGVIYEEEF